MTLKLMIRATVASIEKHTVLHSQKGELAPLVQTRSSGPMTVDLSEFPPSGGGCYYVIFKDDFLSFSAGHIIKHKSEVKDLFVKFCASTMRQCEILRNDMGKEYEATWFNDYLTKEGIKHETTASHTPQQNGVFLTSKLDFNGGREKYHVQYPQV